MNKVEEVLQKLKEIRLKKGFSQQDIVYKMQKEMTQVAYQKIENNKTKLTVERLFEIMEILNIGIEDVFDIKTSEKYIQNIEEGSIGYQQKTQQIENFFQENKEKTAKIEELYQKMLAEKDILIEKLYALLDKK